MKSKAAGTLARTIALVPMLVLDAAVTLAALSLAREAFPKWLGPAFPAWTVLAASSAAMAVAVLARTPSLRVRAAAWIAGSVCGAAASVLLQRYALAGFDPAAVDLWAGFPTLLVLSYAQIVLAPVLAILAAQLVLDLEPAPPPQPLVYSGMIDR
jgi:hypothetical protein